MPVSLIAKAQSIGPIGSNAVAASQKALAKERPWQTFKDAAKPA